MVTKSSIAEPQVSAIVARGRSILAAIEGQTKIVGYSISPEGALAPVTAQVTRELAPGSTYTGPAAEVARLRSLGFLADPEE
jgi:hypothetical protein